MQNFFSHQAKWMKRCVIVLIIVVNVCSIEAIARPLLANIVKPKEATLSTKVVGQDEQSQNKMASFRDAYPSPSNFCGDIECLSSSIECLRSSLDCVKQNVCGDPYCLLKDRVGCIQLLLCNIYSQLAACSCFFNSKVDIVDSKIDDVDSKVDILLQSPQDLSLLSSKVGIIDSKIDIVDSKIDNLSTPCGATPLSGPTRISNPGSYCLTQDCAGTFTIAADNVTLDLNNHTITSGSEGIIITGTAVVVQNGTIANMTGAGIVVTGDRCVVRDCISTSNETGFYLANASGATLSNCQASYNTGKGFNFLHCSGSYITNCQSRYNGGLGDGYGILVDGGFNNQFERCFIDGVNAGAVSTAAGILIRNESLKNTITSCQISNVRGGQNNYGIKVFNPLLIPLASFDHGLSSNIYSVAWLESNGAKYLAVGGESGTGEACVRVLDFNPITPTLNNVVAYNHGAVVSSVSWLESNGIKYLAIGGEPGVGGPSVRIFDFDSNVLSLDEIASFTPDIPTRIYAVSWLESDNKHYLAICGSTISVYDATVSIFDFDLTTSTLSHIVTFTHGTSTTLQCLAWLESNNKKYLAIGGYHGTGGTEVRILDFDPTASTLTEVTNFDHGTSTNTYIYCLAWLESANKKYLAMGGTDGFDNTEVRIMNFDSTASTLTNIASFDRGTDVATLSVAWLESGSKKYLAVGGSEEAGGSEMCMLDFDSTASTLTKVTTFDKESGNAINSLVWLESDGKKYLAVGGTNETGGAEVRVLDFFADYNTADIKKNFVHDIEGIGIAAGCSKNLIINNTTYNNVINYDPLPCSPLADVQLQQSQIDACCGNMGTIGATMVSAVGEVDSKVDILLQSPQDLSNLESKVEEVDSKVDILLQSPQDLSLLSSKVGIIDSKIDIVDSKVDIILQSPQDLSALTSKVGVIDSSVEIISEDINDLLSKTSIIDSKVNELATDCQATWTLLTGITSTVDVIGQRNDTVLQNDLDAALDVNATSTFSVIQWLKAIYYKVK